MANGWSIFIGLAFIIAFSFGSWYLAPKGETQTDGKTIRVLLNSTLTLSHVPQRRMLTEGNSVWRSGLIMSAWACYLMWAITFLAQLHPLINPINSHLRQEVAH